MPTTGRSSKQVARDRAALKRLQKSGIYSGKIDLRKAPSRYQRQKIAELAARKKGKKAASKPAKRATRVRPPKKTANGARIRQREISQKQLKNLPEPKHKLTTYALPFLRKGQEEPEWRRFTYRQLKQFLAEYKPDDPEGAAEWMSYAVAEHWTFPTKQQATDMRRDTNLYFSGRRINEPQGRIRKKIKPKHRAKKKRSKGKRGK